MLRKSLALLVSLSMAVTSLPVNAFGDEIDHQEDAIVVDDTSGGEETTGSLDVNYSGEGDSGYDSDGMIPGNDDLSGVFEEDDGEGTETGVSQGVEPGLLNPDQEDNADPSLNEGESDVNSGSEPAAEEQTETEEDMYDASGDNPSSDHAIEKLAEETAEKPAEETAEESTEADSSTYDEENNTDDTVSDVDSDTDNEDPIETLEVSVPEQTASNPAMAGALAGDDENNGAAGTQGEIEAEGETETFTIDTLRDSDELFADYVNQLFYGSPAQTKTRKKLRSAKPLSGNDQIVFTYLSEAVKGIAAGNTASSIINIPLSVFELDTQTSFSAEVLGVEEIVSGCVYFICIFQQIRVEPHQLVDITGHNIRFSSDE